MTLTTMAHIAHTICTGKQINELSFFKELNHEPPVHFRDDDDDNDDDGYDRRRPQDNEDYGDIVEEEDDDDDVEEEGRERNAYNDDDAEEGDDNDGIEGPENGDDGGRKDSDNSEEGEEEEEGQGLVISSATVLGTIAGIGSYSKAYYRFRNVQLADNNTITFYVAPGQPLPGPYWLDIVTNNGTIRDPSLPTTIMVRAGHLQSYHYMNIRYVASDQEQPECTKWEHRPTYLLTMQHNENIWHAWNDGLLGAFQTLREQGLIPLAEIDNNGNIREYVDDLDPECPRLIEPQGDRSMAVVRDEGCRQRVGVVGTEQTWCDPTKYLWCREGLVALNSSKTGPVLLPFKGIDVIPQWEHLFRSMSSDIVGWNQSLGTCYSELYVGKSNVLQYYLPLRPSSRHHNRTMFEMTKEMRSNATATVKAFMITAERIHRARRHLRKPNLRRWPGYEDPGLERLRQGIGPDEIKALAALKPKKDEALTVGKMTEDEWDELAASMAASAKTARKIAKERAAVRRRRLQADVDAAAEEERSLGQRPGKNDVLERNKDRSSSNPPSRAERPVVTYMWRGNFKRSVFNAQDILAYTLLRYNVTVRVSIFAEPILEAMELLHSTDVLIGMHGAGWTNALFIKRGAAAIQLLPYGWLHAHGKSIRGTAFQAMLEASDCSYMEWGNSNPKGAYFRREDFDSMMRRNKEVPEYAVHPKPSWELPHDKRPGNQWVYQNTLVDLEDFVPTLDAAMKAAGIKPVDTTSI